jgi:hypothetical protein
MLLRKKIARIAVEGSTIRHGRRVGERAVDAVACARAGDSRKAWKLLRRAAAIIAVMAFTMSLNYGSAKAQMMPGWGPPIAAPAFAPPAFVPPPQFVPPQFVPPPPPGFNGTVPVPGIPGGINSNGHDAWGVMGPAIGAGVAAGLQGYGVPAPLAGWAGARVNDNAQAAYREQGPFNQAVRTFSGVSVRDIQDHGILGGDCSFLRNPFGNGC